MLFCDSQPSNFLNLLNFSHREFPFSEELDNFSIGNKRASIITPAPKKNNTINVISYDNNGIDMYGD